MARKHEILSDGYVDSRKKLYRWVAIVYLALFVFWVLGALVNTWEQGGIDLNEEWVLPFLWLAITLIIESRRDSLLENKKLLDRSSTS